MLYKSADLAFWNINYTLKPNANSCRRVAAIEPKQNRTHHEVSGIHK